MITETLIAVKAVVLLCLSFILMTASAVAFVFGMEVIKHIKKD